MSQKVNMCKKAFTAIIAMSIISSLAFAQVYKSYNYSLKNVKIAGGGGNASSANYKFDNAQIGSPYGGKAESANYILDTSNKPLAAIAPNPPTVNRVTSPTNNRIQTLSGTKPQATSIYINGQEVIPLNDATNWSWEVRLNEGSNNVIITTRNAYNLESRSVELNIFLDTSPPTTPVVEDEGITTTSLSEFNIWVYTEDPETGISELQVAIGTHSYGTDIMEWRTPMVLLESSPIYVTCSGFFTQGQIYYISAKTQNWAGSWSEIGCSDGITVNQSIPVITSVYPSDGSSGYIDSNIDFSVTAHDEDGDSLLYRLFLDGQVAQTWQTSPNFNWSTNGVSRGTHLVGVEVSDNHGGRDSREVSLYLFRKPPPVPSP